MAMRLQRALAQAGVASRRASEDLIRAGKVKVNGQVAALGMVVEPDRDQITVVGRTLRPVAKATLVFHKPIGYVVSRNDPQKRPTVFELLPEIPGLSYVGRLDFLTSGLLILTTDGELNNRLSHPRYGVPRRYHVRVSGAGITEVEALLSTPIHIDGKPVDMRRVEVSGGKGKTCEMRLTLLEGRNRIVRRICESLGLTVESLVRVEYGPIRLSGLEPGRWRYVTGDELSRLRKIGGGGS